MAELSFHVPYRLIQEALNEMSDQYVKRIYQPRKDACLMAAGDVLKENGYLPNGTTYEPWNDQLWFSVDKGTGADLAHYFHEGLIYGPNFPVYETDAQGNKTLVGFRSPKGMSKYPIYEMGNRQGINKPSGVAHWTEAVQYGGPLYNQLILRIEEILRK